jgi:hypothetical protein
MVEEKNYVFGDVVGGIMAKTTPKFQMEASMMSVVMLMIGILLTGVYVCFFTDFGLFFKILTGVNTFFGVLLMYSNLVGLFQGYQSMMEVMDIQKAIGGLTSEIFNQELKGGNK